MCAFIIKNFMKFIRQYTLIVLVCSLVSTAGLAQTKYKKLVWADEFSYTGLPDSARWDYDHARGCPVNCGWGNQEAQYYTWNRKKNARVENGMLVLEAHKEMMQDAQYTSTRLVTRNKGDWKYGRIEIRAKLPIGKGIWPAIWMLPTDNQYGIWPRSGEIDIMEFVGFNPDSVFGTIHTEAYNGMRGTQKVKGISLKNLSTAFHTYAIEWSEQAITFFVDDQPINHFTNDHQNQFATWPFDQRFHLILNIAVGGNWGGKYGIDDSIFPQQLLIDYVRVYQ